MAAHTISPSTEFEEFVTSLVASGRYANRGEVLRAAMEALQREECDDAAKEAFLQEALDAAESSGIYEGDAFASVRREMGWETKG